MVSSRHCFGTAGPCDPRGSPRFRHRIARPNSGRQRFRRVL